MSWKSRNITICLILAIQFQFLPADESPCFQRVVSELKQDLPSILKCWSLRFFDPIDEHPEFPRHMEGDTPVILIHGYLHDISGWTKFRDSLNNANLGPVYVPRLTNSSGDIRHSASEIAAVIQYVLKETGQNQVILIGHSMGGIVASYCTQHFAEKGSVKAVVTIGSPLRGTRLSKIGFGKASKQMSYQSPFLKKLTAQMNYNPKAEYFCIASTADEVVKPFQSAFYKEPDDMVHFCLYDDVGHQSYLFNDHVISEVILMIHTLDNSRSSDHSEMLVWFRKSFQ